MKKHQFIALIFFLLAQVNVGFGQPPSISNITLMPPNDPSGINSIPQYEVQEIDFSLYPYYTTPHDPDVIQVYALIDNPSHTKQIRVDAFFYVPYDIQQRQIGCSWPCDNPVILPTSRSNDGIFEETIPNKELLNHGYWQIRFTPDEPGNWTVSIFADDNMQVTPHPPFEITCMASPYSKGFITLANDKYLKYTTGEFFFPVGMNTWSPRYNSDCNESNQVPPPCELGTQYFRHILAKLSENKANTIRIILDMYAYGENIGFSLLGPDLNYGSAWGGNYYSFNLYNQKDAAQLDNIIKFAQGHGVKIQLCLLMHGATQIHKKDANGNITGDGDWITKNPYSTTGNAHNNGFLSSPQELFTDALAKKHTKDLFRYYSARWGAYTNILSWELWSEVNSGGWGTTINGTHLADWHREMYSYLKTIDPYNHLITTSFAGSPYEEPTLYPQIFKEVDYVQSHVYKGYTGTNGPLTNFQTHFFSDREMTYNTYNLKKPILVGETGFGEGREGHNDDDPKGVELHNSLWSSAFSGHMGSSLNWWDKHYIDNLEGKDLYHLFTPVSKFMNAQKVPSQQVTPTHGITTSGLRWYELTDNSDINNTTIIGWAQDKNFHFTDIYHNASGKTTKPYLKDLVTARPDPNTPSNHFEVGVAEPDKEFVIEWYNSETGEIVNREVRKSNQNVIANGYQLVMPIPNSLRNGPFSDGVYKVVRNCTEHIWREGAYINNVNQNVNTNIVTAKETTGQVFYGGTDKKLYSYWFDHNDNRWKLTSTFPSTNDVEGDIAINKYENQVYYRSTDNNIKAVWWNGSTWVPINYNNLTNGNVKGPIVMGPNDEVYYRTLNNEIHALVWNGSTYVHSNLNNATIGNVGSSIAVASNGQVFYKTTDGAMNQLWNSGSAWVWGNMNNTVPIGTINSPSNITIQPNTTKLYYVNTNNELHHVKYDFNINNWVSGGTTLSGYTNAAGDLNAIANEKILLRNQQSEINLIYLEDNEWKWSNLTLNNHTVMVPNTGLIYDENDNYISYVTTPFNNVRRLYYKPICYETASPNFQKNDPTTLGTKNLEEKVSNKVKIYPNPSNGKFTISSETTIEKWVLKNVTGVSILSSDKLLKNTDTIDASNLSSGIYFITIINNNGQESNHKIIIK